MTEEERFRRHYRLFQMLDENTLVILDNFDVTADREELLHEFLSFSFPLLVTTRIHFEDVEVYPVCEIQSKNKLLELFYTYAPCTASKKEAVILDIIDEVYRHTLTVEMAAKTLKASALEPEELLTALKEHGIQHMDTDKIGVTKDSHRKTDSMYRHLEILFRIQNLSKEKVNHLRYLALVDDKGIEKATFKTWLQLSDLNDINELIENGWVRTDATETCILLHPLIREMINAFEKPTFENCMPFFLGMSVPLFQRQVGFDSSCEVLSVLKNSCKYILPDSKDAFTNLMQFATEYIVDYLNQCVSLDELPPRESVIYYLLWGGITLHRKNIK